MGLLNKFYVIQVVKSMLNCIDELYQILPSRI